MSEFNPSQLVNLHYSNVMDWLVLNGFVSPRIESTGTTPQCVIDIDIQFAKLHFTENKVASVPPEITCLMKSDITYVDATSIYNFLEQSEGKGCARNIFGLFKSEALKSWWNLLRSWEKGNLHLSHAVNTLVKFLGHDIPFLQRKFQAAEKTVRTIDNRLIELQRASLSYDRAYSDECKAMKKRPKDGGGYDSQRSDPEDSNDLNMLYNEIVNDIGVYQFARSMDYVFAFSKFAWQGSQTAHSDYHSIYKCLCAVGAITSGSVDKGLDTPSHDSIEVVGLEGLHLLIRDENFSQELLLELQGLRAFLTQKLVTLEAQEDSGISLDMPSVSTTTAIDVLTHIKIVDSIIRKLKRVRIKILNQSQFSSSPVDGALDQVRCLRARAVTYRTIFEELKQNRQDVAFSLHRYASDLSRLKASCKPLRQWLDLELSKLTDTTVNIRYG